MTDPMLETILVVDDDPAVLRQISQILSVRGYPVLTATCGREALRTCERHASHIPVLLTDVMMPGISGLELAAMLSQWNPLLHCVFMSEHNRETLFAGTQRHFIPKPITEEKLLRKLRDVLSETPVIPALLAHTATASPA